VPQPDMRECSGVSVRDTCLLRETNGGFASSMVAVVSITSPIKETKITKATRLNAERVEPQATT